MLRKFQFLRSLGIVCVLIRKFLEARDLSQG